LHPEHYRVDVQRPRIPAPALRHRRLGLAEKDELRRAVFDVHDSDFQQIQGGQQIGILDGTALGNRNSWLIGAIAGFSFILNRLNLLASLNLLE
jgi:hypothetical protein